MYIFLIFLVSLSSTVGSTSVNITTTRLLRDPDEVMSDNSYFRLGFFSPANSTYRYLGIWYSTGSNALEVVWVANKDDPLKDSSGVLKVSENGDLQVLDGQSKVLWSSNSAHDQHTSNSWVARLLDTGNLVLLSGGNGRVIWQSFEHPTNSLLPQMRIYNHGDKDESEKVIRSWKNPWDPSSGHYSLGVTSSYRVLELVTWDNGQPYSRSGPWNGNFFIGGTPRYYWGLTNGFTLVNDSLMFSSQNPATLDHYELSSDGVLFHKQWNETNREWEVMWRSIVSECDVYGKCGPFGRCNPRKSPICSCLDGFHPTNIEEWSNGNWTSGCSRRTPLQCGNMTGNSDGFLRLRNMKVPYQAEWLAANHEDDCRMKCHAQCSCVAYAYYLGIGCMTWSQNLMDIQELTTTVVDLFLRLAHSELADQNRKWKTTVVVAVVTGTITFAVVAFLLFRWISRPSGRILVTTGKGAERKDILPNDSMLEISVNDLEFKDLQLFKLDKLAVATNKFHLSNKLGQGGFGTVFKGDLQDGQEIAVKRLSKGSEQGLQEFMNEVLLISKLQHRNLVRLLGCCVEGEEKMLVYEYMPNRSLDALLFDSLHRALLDWKTRLTIIEGICWGLLYLHRDSRLRIIHRDLKASNILLDEDLNPKISDFGMAKIFGGKEDQSNTSRVVGTYGYMSPEYAMEGWFSEKSDVYSFGVLLLEIVSGRRNNSFKDDDCGSLLGYVWKLWNEDDVLSLIDPTIGDPCFREEVLKCIQLGLLCVQEFPEDRPTISSVVSMLDSQISDLPCPMKPGFTHRRKYLPHKVTTHGEPSSTVNSVSVTVLSGR